MAGEGLTEQERIDAMQEIFTDLVAMAKGVDHLSDHEAASEVGRYLSQSLPNDVLYGQLALFMVRHRRLLNAVGELPVEASKPFTPGGRAYIEHLIEVSLDIAAKFDEVNEYDAMEFLGRSFLERYQPEACVAMAGILGVRLRRTLLAAGPATRETS